MYYLLNMNKKEIGERLGITRFRVSRILQQAHQDGIVTININESYPTFTEIEEKLEKRFHLQHAIVVEPVEYTNDAIMLTIGRSAADRLVTLLNNGDILGITWGATVNEVVKALPSRVDTNIKVVQITGGLDQMGIDVNAMDIVRRTAAIYDAEIYILHAPAFVTSKTAREALLSNSGIQKTVGMFDKVNVALSGIGAFSDQLTSNLLMSGNLSKQDIAQLHASKAVGDVFGHFFDIDGQICDTELEERIMGMSIDQLKRVHYSMGIAGGKHKSRAILGALRGKLLNILVTDRLTACKILQEDGYYPTCE